MLYFAHFNSMPEGSELAKPRAECKVLLEYSKDSTKLNGLSLI